MADDSVTGGGLHRKRFEELNDQAKKLYAWIEPDFTVDPPQCMDDLNPDDLLAWRVKVRNLLSQACGVDSEHYKVFLEVEGHSDRRYFEMFDSLFAVFSAAREDFEGGYVQSVRSGGNKQDLEIERELQNALETGYSPGRCRKSFKGAETKRHHGSLGHVRRFDHGRSSRQMGTERLAASAWIGRQNAVGR